MKKTLVLLLALVLTGSAASLVLAAYPDPSSAAYADAAAAQQAYPSKPIRLISAFPPGGSSSSGWGSRDRRSRRSCGCRWR